MKLELIIKEFCKGNMKQIINGLIIKSYTFNIFDVVFKVVTLKLKMKNFI